MDIRYWRGDGFLERREDTADVYVICVQMMTMKVMSGRNNCLLLGLTKASERFSAP